MIDPHPVTPPPELVKKIFGNALRSSDGQHDYELRLIHAAYAAGADHELKACCALLLQEGAWPWPEEVARLRAARRPKPPNLKAQALAALSRADKDALTNPLTGEVVALRTILSKEQSNTIRRALEALDD